MSTAVTGPIFGPPARTLDGSGSHSAFAGTHAGATMLVFGCGVSAQAGADAAGLPTIGVNDIGRLFTPTYLVVVNPPRQFRGDRFAHVRQSRAQALFTQIPGHELGTVAPPVVPIRLGRYAGIPQPGDEVLHYTQNSPYVAVCLAAMMGARRIGLLGVDFTDDHFFAPTGRHPLAARLATIDREYGRLAAALAARGIELVNLSPVSRLTQVPRGRLADFAGSAAGTPVVALQSRRVFIVNFRFQTCGDVFADGLRHAAAALGLAHAEAAWDDPRLPEKVAAFAPDLLFVVHGRRFVQRWGHRFAHLRSAVWLVDEPYEVDDTAAWSHHFGTVFVNDPATLARHRHAHYLPTAYDPVLCRDDGDAGREHRVGFVGGPSPTRERLLCTLAEAGALGYVVGGPWRDARLRRLALAPYLPHPEVAALYRRTRVVVNVFRDRHHFNAAALPAQAMNPRIYEALACGALVVSERRTEIAEVFPQLPQFDAPGQAVQQVLQLLADDGERRRRLADCQDRLAAHRYQDRLARALALAVDAAPPRPALALVPPAPAPALPPAAPLPLHAATPRRHLLYHLWPVKGSTWRWNVEQLLRRIDLFNGRRVVAVVHDARCEDLATVRAAFAGHGCEFIEADNDPLGESVTFPRLLERVSRESPADVSFYAHAKGVKYEPQFPPAVRRWAEVQYAAMLDHWPAVRVQLRQLAMCGMLRRTGRFANHQRVGDWHYSGTFFWFRHDAVFSRGWQQVPQFYGGVEAWPGTLFSTRETGCLLLDGVREVPYHERFWAQRGNPEFLRWKQAQRPVPPPPDLLHPPPFEGHAQVRLEQRADEFTWWLQRLHDAGARRLLVIGSPFGGVEWHAARRAASAGRALSIVTLQPGTPAALAAAQADARARFGADWQLVQQADALEGRFDAAFVDGDHGDAACRADVALALAHGVRMLALHDIADSDWHAAAHCAVSRTWHGLQSRCACEARSGGDWGGIGIAWVDRDAP